MGGLPSKYKDWAPKIKDAMPDSNVGKNPPQIEEEKFEIIDTSTKVGGETQLSAADLKIVKKDNDNKAQNSGMTMLEKN